MQDIFDIKFPIETKIKDEVITKFSNKQGGAFNIFSQYWQPFVWAATIGFLRNERHALAPGTERIFNMNIMIGNGGEKDARALVCMCVARTGSLDIMKDPEEAIRVISEYANGGFYHIKKLIENGENTFNDMEKVKQEIFTRNYGKVANLSETQNATKKGTADTYDFLPIVTENNPSEVEEEVPLHTEPRVHKYWTVLETNDLKRYYKQGLSIEQLATFLSHSEQSVKEQLTKLGLL